MKRKRRSVNTGKYMLLRNSSIFIFVIIFILIGTGYAMVNTQIEIEGKATMLANETPDNPGISGGPSLSVASVTIPANWGQGAIVVISITNNDEDYEGWYVSFEVPEETTDLMLHNNAYIYGASTNLEGNVFTVSMDAVNSDGSTNWNGLWAVGDTKEIQIQFSFSSTVNNLDFNNFIFNGKIITIDSEAEEDEIVTENNSINELNTNEEELEEEVEENDLISSNNNVVENNDETVSNNNVVEQENVIDTNSTTINENNIIDSSNNIVDLDNSVTKNETVTQNKISENQVVQTENNIVNESEDVQDNNNLENV